MYLARGKSYRLLRQLNIRLRYRHVLASSSYEIPTALLIKMIHLFFLLVKHYILAQFSAHLTVVTILIHCPNKRAVGRKVTQEVSYWEMDCSVRNVGTFV